MSEQPAAIDDRPLTRKQAAGYITEKFGLPMSPATLASYASKGGGPEFHKNGRRTFYPKPDLDAWVIGRRTQTYHSTSHEAETKRAAS
jgi:hypothetical protein